MSPTAPAPLWKTSIGAGARPSGAGARPEPLGHRRGRRRLPGNSAQLTSSTDLARRRRSSVGCPVGFPWHVDAPKPPAAPGRPSRLLKPTRGTGLLRISARAVGSTGPRGLIEDRPAVDPTSFPNLLFDHPPPSRIDPRNRPDVRQERARIDRARRAQCLEGKRKTLTCTETSSI